MNGSRYYLLLLAALIMAVSGCSTIDYLKVHPEIKRINQPQRVVILPFSNVMGLEVANETANAVFTGKFQQLGYAAQLIEPATAIAALADPELARAVTQLRMQFSQTSTVDKAALGQIMASYDVDAVIWGDITQWGTTSSGLTRAAQVGMSVKMVAETGEILWSAMHTTENEQGALGRMVGAVAGFDIHRTALEVTCDTILKSYPFK